MNTNRRRLLHLSALSTAALALPGCGIAAVSERSGSPDRPVVHRAPRSDNLSCDNAAVPASDPGSRLATLADFGQSTSCEMLTDSFEGPFFFCTNPGGAQIAQGKPGDGLRVALRAINAATCQPIPDAVIDIWHCDASGVYSGYGLGVDEAARQSSHSAPATRERYCRGALRTDSDGIAEFRSIYPGYYVGRAIHIHFKLHVGNRAFLTNQALLPEPVNEAVMQLPPYRGPRKRARVTNAQEQGWGLPTMQIVERQQTRLAVMNLAVGL